MSALTRRRILAAASLVLAVPAYAEPAESPVASAMHTRARLLVGDHDPASGRYRAAIDIALDRGFKTYWRHPGESGLPASFDWSGSENVAHVEPLWPAPRRFEEAGLVMNGYPDGLLLPLVVTPHDPQKAVRLRLGLDYGVCKEICIPVRAELALALRVTPSPHLGAIEAAVAQVPVPTALGAGGDLAILQVSPLPMSPTQMSPLPGAGKIKRRLAVRVRAPAGSDAALFVEAPERWFLGPDAGMTRISPEEGTFTVTVFEAPRQPAGPITLRLTLVAGGQAIESSLDLDSAGLAR